MPAKPRLKLRHGHKMQVIASSSDSNPDSEDHENDEEEAEETECTPGRARTSHRLAEKRKKVFSLPSRESVWNTIPDSKKPIENLRLLSPRKSVSNYTKVYNTYNFDDYEDSSDDSEVTDSSSSSSIQSVKKKRRIQNYHRRIAQGEESSSDDESVPVQKNAPSFSSDLKTGGQEESNVAQNEEGDVGLNMGEPEPCGRVDSTSSDSEEVQTPRNKSRKVRRKSALLDSESDDDVEIACVQENNGDEACSDNNKVLDKLCSKSCEDDKADTVSCKPCSKDNGVGNKVLQETRPDNESESKGNNLPGARSENSIGNNRDEIYITDDNQDETSESDSSGSDNQTRSEMLKRMKERERKGKFKDLILARKKHKLHS